MYREATTEEREWLLAKLYAMERQDPSHHQTWIEAIESGTSVLANVGVEDGQEYVSGYRIGDSGLNA